MGEPDNLFVRVIRVFRGQSFLLLPTLIVLVLAVYPQVAMWIANGRVDDAVYFVANYDEPAYSAYVNALIEGRPRRADPFMGTDAPDYESIYSVQMVPAYLIAIPARLLGLSAGTAFIVLNFVLAILCSLLVFWLLRSVTGDPLISAIGVLVVLLLGTAAAFQGELRQWAHGSVLVDFFPFLRRYQPGVAFPMFLAFCLTVWKSLADEQRSRRLLFAVLSGVLFAALVFSYFFMWTTAAAWLACLCPLWFFARKDDRRSVLTMSGVIAAFGLAVAWPYVSLLSDRHTNTDETQLLAYTREPDLVASPEVIGFVIIIALLAMVRVGRAKFDSPQVLFALSLALAPFLLFNQQVITGRSLQPVHYQLFSANYMVVIAAMVTIWVFMRSLTEATMPRMLRAVSILAGVAIVAGGIESYSTAIKYDRLEQFRIRTMPAMRYLRGLQTPAETSGGRYPTVLSTSIMVADYLPTVTTFRPMWTPHTNSTGGVDYHENRRLLYLYLYFGGYGEETLKKGLDDYVFEFRAALFGGGRALSELDGGAQPITADEVAREVRLYGEFLRSVDRETITQPELSYLVIPLEAEPDYTRLDKWYVRSDDQIVGDFRVARLTPRP